MVEAILSFSLYDNQSAFDAGIGAIFVGDLITLSEGSNFFSRQLYADIPGAGSFVEISGTEELFVRVNSRLRGLAPTPEGGNFPITDVAFWTASVSGCLDVSPDDSDPSPTPTPTPTLVEQLVESLKRILSGILSH